MATTSTAYATGANGTQSAGSWASTANATGSTAGTVATWTSTGSNATGTLELTGYDGQSMVGGVEPYSIDSVTVDLAEYVTNATRVPTITAQLFSGGTAIGSPVSLTATTTTSNVQTITFPTAPTWAQCADLRVKIVFTRGAVTTAGNGRVDYVGMRIDYSTVATVATVRSRAQGAQTTDSTSHAITLPAGVQADDLLLVAFTIDTATTVTSTTSPGWARLVNVPQGSTTNHTGSIWWKRATGSDALTIDSSSAEQSTHISLCIKDGADPEATTNNGASASTATPAGITPAAGSGNYLGILSIHTDSSAGTTQNFGTASGYSNVTTQQASTTASGATCTQEQTYTAVTTWTPGTVSLSLAEQWVAITVSVGLYGAVTNPLIETFTDAFDSIGAIWVTGGTPTITDGRLNLACTAAYTLVNSMGTGGGFVESLTGSSCQVEVVQTPLIGNGSTQAYFFLASAVGAGAKCCVQMSYGNGNLFAEKVVAGSAPINIATIAYDATDHRWWRIRESGGTIYFEAGPDGTSWPTAVGNATVASVTGFVPGAVMVELGSGYWGTETTPRDAIFDNLNINAEAASDTVTLVENRTLSVQTARTDIIPVSQARALSVTLPRSDVISFTEKTRIVSATLARTDQIGFRESASVTIAPTLLARTDQVALRETASVAVLHSRADNVAFTEKTRTLAVTHARTDVVPLVESRQLAVSLARVRRRPGHGVSGP